MLDSVGPVKKRSKQGPVFIAPSRLPPPLTVLSPPSHSLLYELALKRVTGKLHPDTLDCCRYTPCEFMLLSVSGSLDVNEVFHLDSLTGFSASGRSMFLPAQPCQSLTFFWALEYYFLPQVEVINKYLVQLDAESKKSRSRMDYERFVQVRTHAASVALDVRFCRLFDLTRLTRNQTGRLPACTMGKSIQRPES